jgi:hypothetical protein
MSDKIKPHHLGRKAILYVRQSSAHPPPRRRPHSPLPTSTPRSLCASRGVATIGSACSSPPLSRGLSIRSCKRPNFMIGQRDRYVEEGVRARQGSVEQPTNLHWR